MKMDPKYVQQMFELGGTLIIFGIPAGTEFGIDLKAWNVGDEFKGVKMIPPGPHFIYVSSVNKYGQTAPRTGFFHYFEQKEVVVKKYNVDEEDICDEEDLEKVERIKLNLKNIDRHLGSFPFESWTKWISFTQHINQFNLKRLDPLSGVVCSAPELVNKADLEKGDSSPLRAVDCLHPTEEEEDLSSSPPETKDEASDAPAPPLAPKLPDMIPRPGTEIRFSTFPRKPHKVGATPEEISRGNLDSTYTINFILEQLDRPESLLSEVQYSFVVFLVGHSWEGWEHWRRLVLELCKAEEALLEHPNLYSEFLSLLHYQIQEVPEDLFADIVESNNFMVVSLRTLFANIFENALALPVGLVAKAKKFRGHLTAKFSWNLTLEEDGEDMPVVVET